MGSRGTPEIRAREAREAADVLGVQIRRNAGLPDAHLDDSHENRERLARLIRELRPAVVVTHWLEGRHPDHVATARLVLAASFLSGLKNFPAGGVAFRPRKIVHATLYREDTPAPSFVVDVTPQVDRKLRALACYASQFEGATAAGEMLDGNRPFADQVQAHLAYWGARIRVPYGEPFWTRETLSADSLGRLGVSTF